MSTRHLRVLGALSVVLSACNDPCPHYALDCADAAASPVAAAMSVDRTPARHVAASVAPAGISFLASTGAIARFVGTDSFKLILGTGKHLYLLLPDPDTSRTPRSFQIDRGDEGPNGNAGWPNEPLFSPDGRWIAYNGTFTAKTDAYVREAVGGAGWRIPLVRSEAATAHPHWYREGDSLWIYLADIAISANWSVSEQRVNGNTWRTRFLDTAVGVFQIGTLAGKPIPGAFKGGISRDGKWVGTSYKQSVLWNSSTGMPTVLNGGEQQCNPSMNPFASGSNTDYMMILGFGGATPVPTLAGSVLEGQHEHLWIWSKDDKAVWRAALPNVAPHASNEIPGLSYTEWQRPEWSTHPDYATALAKRSGTGEGMGYDLFLVKLGERGGELAAHDRSTMLERGPVLRVATGSMISSDWSHLWVKP